jgi:hypothetical protein
MIRLGREIFWVRKAAKRDKNVSPCLHHDAIDDGVQEYRKEGL